MAAGLVCSTLVIVAPFSAVHGALAIQHAERDVNRGRVGEVEPGNAWRERDRDISIVLGAYERGATIVFVGRKGAESARTPRDFSFSSIQPSGATCCRPRGLRFRARLISARFLCSKILVFS